MLAFKNYNFFPVIPSSDTSTPTGSKVLEPHLTVVLKDLT